MFFIPAKYIPVNRQYSTDEQLTREVWIDEKSIWRRVYSGLASESLAPIAAVDTILNARGVLNKSSTGSTLFFNDIYASSIIYRVEIGLDSLTGAVSTTAAATGYGTWNQVLVFEYTKL